MMEETGRFRHELKYLISAAQIPLLKSRIEPMMSLDPHTGPKGWYTVRSLYFDDIYNSCFYENENGTEPREKLRIRIYPHSPGRIMLECKKKEHGMTSKTGCLIAAEQAECLVQQTALPTEELLPALLRKLDLKRKTDLLRPAVIVEYERIPYVYRDGNVRVTFDCNISASRSFQDFFQAELSRKPVLLSGMHLMEVKFDEFLPDPIYHSLNLGTLRQTAFSKYYLCRKFAI